MKCRITAAICCFLIAGCSSGAVEKEPKEFIEVKIVNVQEYDRWMGYGASGATVLELPDGTRKRIGGLYGKEGDTFKAAKDTSRPSWPN